MDLMGTDDEKAALRLAMRERRLSIVPTDGDTWSMAAARHLVALPAVAAATTVACYMAMPGELSTVPLLALLEALKKRIAIPRVIKGSRILAFHEHIHGALVASKFGVPEPHPTAPEISLDHIDVFVVPGLAFDLDGDRLGWGRAHYDNTLAAAPRALRVGLAFELQIVPAVPHGAQDERVDVLVTEVGGRATRRRPT
jgi:5-formyltetrahydrofolate cyclo-ligase